MQIDDTETLHIQSQTFDLHGMNPSCNRTSGGAEVDLILEEFFGLIPIEIKRGQRVDSRDLRGLKDFLNERNCAFGIVINNDLSPGSIPIK